MITKNIERILVLPAAGLGDLVMAAPVIRAIRVRFPQASIAVLAHQSRGAAEIGAAMPYLDEVIDFPMSQYSWSAVIKFFLTSFWPMLSKLRGQKFDTVIILNPNPIRSIIVKMLRPATCLCPTSLGHPTKIGLELASQLGCSIEPLDFGFTIPAANLDHSIAPDSPRPWVGIHPFSAMAWRYWQGFDDLTQKLESFGGTVILLGKNSRHRPRTNCIDTVNKLSIAESLSLISKLDVLVSCDSGPMHLGFAVGTPTVALFGTVPPQFRMPLRDADKHCAIYLGKANAQCMPIKERKPTTINPLDDISANEVYNGIMQLLKSQK